MNPCPKKYPHKATTSVVSGQDSPAVKSTDKLNRSVVPFMRDRAGTFPVHVHRSFDTLIPNRGSSGRAAATRQRKLNFC